MKKLYILVIALFAINVANAQWVPQNSGTSTNLFSVYFTDSNTGYIGGWNNLLLKTLDGGTTWDTLNTPYGVGWFNSVFFTDANTGYAAGNGMLKTVDAGLTWTDQTCCSGDLTSVFFTDANIGYTVSYEDAGWSHYWIYKTIDGGTTWFIASEGDSEQFYSIFFPDTNTGYAVGTSIIKTTDGGTTWNTVLNIQPPGILNSVFFTDSNTGYAVGNSMIKTTDGGTTWDTLSTGATSFLNAVYFINANTGYAVGNSGTIIKTIDAGLTWDAQSSGTTDGLSSIYFPTFDTGYIVGGNGTILKTTNGGGPPVGVNDKPLNSNSLKIYPNPSSGKITIETTGQSHLSILNLSGQEIISSQITGPKTILDVSTLPSGVYIVRVTGEMTLEVGKIVKH